MREEVGSVGKVIDGVTVLIDANSNEELIGEGEIIVQGHNVMKGYHNRPDANDEVFNEDGYSAQVTWDVLMKTAIFSLLVVSKSGIRYKMVST